jgi:hypothetical protein
VSTRRTLSKQEIFASIVTGMNVLIASGYSLAGLVSSNAILPLQLNSNPASAVFAMYAAARTLPLAAFAFIAIYRRSRSGLVILGSLAGCVQFVDGFVGWYQHDVLKTVGPFVLAALQMCAVYAAIPKKLLTREEVAATIERFLDGGDDPYEWDDFTSGPITDPELRALRDRCVKIGRDFRARHSHEWCSDEGRTALRALAQEIRKAGG